MNEYLSIQTDREYEIEGKPHTITFVVATLARKHPWYWIKVMTDTGFTLTDSSYGVLKGFQPANTRLRSEASIVADLCRVLDAYVAAVDGMAPRLILTERRIRANVRGDTVYLDTRLPDVPFFPATNIHSIESGLSVSWYSHDIFKQGPIELIAYREPSGQLRFKAHDADLYDKDKLKQLHDSERFQNSRLAFFCYNEVRRLLGIPIKGHPQRMSGLFHVEGACE